AALIFDEVDAPDNERPEVDRTELRRVLLESVPPEMIRWNHKLKAIWQQDGGAWELVFENGERGVFDLVVGADGAWSKVRPLVSDAQPIYSGFTFVEFGIDDVDRSHPEIAALVGRGKIFALGDSKGLICQRNSNSHFRVYAALPMSENPDECGLDLSSPAQAKASLLSYYAGWSPKLLALIWSSAEWMSPRPLYSLPVGHVWRSVRGLTLLGDAAHLMSPFGGEGVNLAMRDASDLALAVADALEAGADWHAAVADYEKVICERAAEPAAGALEGLNATMAENAIESVLAHMRSHYPQPA
ncbi:MAG: nah, partial [Akkermansiaceae bacterium]|nr:nah [Akkermansiaceae bacterium]